MDPILTGAAANVTSETAKGIFQEVKPHVRYVINCKKMVEEFEDKMKSLIAKRESVQQEIAAAERNLEMEQPDVKLWCERVEKIIDEEAKKVKELEDKAKAKCFLGLCPNIRSRYQLSRKAEDAVVAIDKLLEEGRFDKVAVPYVPEAPISAASKNFEAFDSRKKVFNKIMKALEDPTISMIGVYGPGGVGKTTLVDEVAGKVKEVASFGSVVKATVTQAPNIEKIQYEIAEPLGLKLEERSKEIRARRLSERLKNEKNILVILDDIWTELDLDEVGIPFGDQHKGCKILLTSRDENVLAGKMNAKRIFKIDVLETAEAWELFKRTAENDFENLELLSVATEVAVRCGGLPLAVVTVAKALRKKALSVWKDASLQLQRPSPRNFTGIAAKAYSAIELSYNNLESEELKQTFLLSCLLGHNALLEDLFNCAIGLRLFHGVRTIEETRNRVSTMVSSLKASCLLIDGYDIDQFSVHDFVRDVALAIAYRDNHAFELVDGEVSEVWADEERIERFKMILVFASIKKLPRELDCPQLSLFSMRNTSEDSYGEMPTSFFQKMKNIKVLDLYKMDLSSSISLPISLRTLLLEQCMLGDMVNLEKLKNLEILGLSYSKFEMLPEEVRQLEKLRLLDLSHCTELRKIPPGVLSSLFNLEELYMSHVDFPWNEQGNASLDELKDLTTLHIKIPDVNMVPKHLFSKKLQRYKILIGNEWDWDDKAEYSRTLTLKRVQFIGSEDEGCWEGNLNTTIQRLFTEKVGYRGLDHLILSDHSSELMKILRQNPQGILDFKSLKSLEVYDCSTLSSLLTLSMAPQLQEINVRNCIEMEHIIIDEEPEGEVKNKIVFPLLKSIILASCGDMASFYRGNKILECPSLEVLAVFDCPEMFAFASTFSREQIIGTIDGEGNTIWPSEGVADVFATAFFDNKVSI
ncbi:hypothetical protein DITRI_Ditri06bG0162800 [Diplodiscus trichospermus]